MSESNHSTKQYIILVGITVLIGLALRLYVLNTLTSAHLDSKYTLSKVTLNYTDIREKIENNQNRWVSAKELISNDKSTGIDYLLLHKHLSASNHPPFYYYLYHPLTMLKYLGIPVISIGYYFNLILWVLSAFMFFKITQSLFGDHRSVLLSMMLYCFNLASINTVILVKSYVLLEFLFLSLVYVFIRQSKTEKLSWRNYFMVGFLALLTLQTHYFSYIIVAVFGLLIFYYRGLIKKEWTPVFFYGMAIVGACLVSYLLYPNVIRDISSGRVASKIHGNLMDVQGKLHMLVNATQNIIGHIYNLPAFLMMAIGGFSILVSRHSLKQEVLCVSIITFGIVSYLAIYQFLPSDNSPLRYGSMIAPLLLLIPALLTRDFNHRYRFAFLSFSFLLVLYPCIQLGLLGLGKIHSTQIVQNWQSKEAFPHINKEKIVILQPIVNGRTMMIPYDFPKSEFLFFSRSVRDKEVLKQTISQKTPPLVLIYKMKFGFREGVLNQLTEVGYAEVGKHKDYLVYAMKPN